MRALVIYCHPRKGCFSQAIRDVVLARLEQAGAEVRLSDLYGNGFSPVLTAAELERYEDQASNRQGKCPRLERSAESASCS